LAPQIARVQQRIASSFASSGALANAGAVAGESIGQALGKTFGKDVSGLVVPQEMARVEGALVKESGKAGRKAGQEGARQFQDGFQALAAFAIARRIGRLFLETAGASISFEQAFVGVRKTVSASEAEFATLERQFRDLALRIPVVAEDIAKVGEVAGQLQVPVPIIASFTEEMLKLGVSTDLTADQAASSLARFAAVMDFPITQVGRLGSVLVALGNEAGVTESETLQVATLLAGLGKTAGISADAILGIAAGMRRVGAEFEAGSSAIQRTVDTLQRAGREGGSSLTELSELTGIAREEFARLASEAPAEALVAFLRGVRAQGQGAIETLERFGLADLRVSRELRRVASGVSELERALGISSKAFEENSAATEEANRFYQTSEGRLKLLQNRFRETQIELGGKLAPVLIQVTGLFANMDKSTVAVVGSLGLVLSAGFAVSRLGSIFGEVAKSLNKVTIGGKSAGKALSVLGKIGIGVLAFDLLGQALGALTNKLDELQRGKADIDGTTLALLQFSEGSKAAADVLSKARVDTSIYFDSFREGAGFLDKAGRAFQDFAGHFPGLQGATENSRKSVDDLDKALVKIAEQSPETARRIFERLNSEVEDLNVSAENVPKIFDDYTAALDANSATAKVNAIVQEELAASTDAVGISATEAAAALAQTVASASSAFNALFDQFTPDFGDTFAVQVEKTSAATSAGTRSALSNARTLREAREALTKAREDGARRIAEAERRLVEAEETGLERIAAARRALSDARAASRRRVRDAQQELQDFEAALARTGSGALSPEDAIRLRELNEAVTDAQQDARLAEREGRITLRSAEEEAAEAIAEAQRKITEAHRAAAEAIRNAQQRIGDALDRGSANAERNSGRSAKAVKNVVDTVGELQASFVTNARNLNEFFDLLEDAADRVLGVFDRDIAEPFLARLAEMGPAAIPILRQLRNLSEAELEKLVLLFGDQVKAAKRAMDNQFDKYPSNVRQKLNLVNNAIAFGLADMVAEWDERFGDMRTVTNEAGLGILAEMEALVAQLEIQAEAGGVALTPIQKGFLDLFATAGNAGGKVDALKGLLASLDGKRFKTDLDLDIEAAFSELPARARSVELNLGFKLAHGMRNFGGGLASVGEQGPELVNVPAGSDVFSHTESRNILRNLARFGTLAQLPPININEVASDPMATARAVSNVLAMGSRR
jgi:TP901 family phage tail tape measure protein